MEGTRTRRVSVGVRSAAAAGLVVASVIAGGLIGQASLPRGDGHVTISRHCFPGHGCNSASVDFHGWGNGPHEATIYAGGTAKMKFWTGDGTPELVGWRGSGGGVKVVWQEPDGTYETCWASC